MILRHLYFILRNVILFTILMSISAQASWTPYVVKRGDQLGKIVHNLGFHTKLWGEGGLVNRVFIKNKSILKSQDFIIIGQVIYLPQALEDFEDIVLKKNNSIEKQATQIVQSVETKDPATIFEDELSEENNTEKKLIDVKRNAKLSMGIVVSLMDISLTDKTTNAGGVVQSDPIYGFVLISNIPISKLWNIDTSVAYRKIEFASSQSRTFAVNSSSFLRFSLGGSREFKSFNFGTGIVYEYLPIINGVSAVSIGVSGLNVISPYVTGDWNFYSWENTNLHLEFLGLYNLSGSGDNLMSGFETQAALNLKRKISETLSYSVVPFVQFGSKETNTVDHSYTDIGMRLLINWSH